MARATRRHQTLRMKARAAKILNLWRVKAARPEDVTRNLQGNLSKVIGRNAAMHCTHICGMCKYEKRFGIPRIKARQSVRITSF
jgi:hypothetical protein